jgi:hypothetical protein
MRLASYLPATSLGLMSRKKVTLQLEPSILAETRKEAGELGLSAFVNEILRIHLQHQRLRRLMLESADEHGHLPAEVREEVERQWQEIDAWLIRQARTVRD